MNRSVADDDLLQRNGLPARWLPLAEELPRADWPHSTLHAMAHELLAVHDAQRANLGSLVQSGHAWSANESDGAAYRSIVLPQLSDFLRFLETHHRLESQRFFPMLAAADPRTRGAFDLLDRDHDAIHALMDAAWRHAQAFDARLSGGVNADTEAAALAAAIERLAAPLARHLRDEEDIVVPHLTLRGFELPKTG